MERLTPRQLETLDLKCRRGLTYDGVGYALGIATGTVKNHVTMILRRLNVGSTQQACFLYGRDVGRIDTAAMRARDV